MRAKETRIPADKYRPRKWKKNSRRYIKDDRDRVRSGVSVGGSINESRHQERVTAERW